MIAKPNFIGIGGHKCASTWLSECMREHPEIFVTNPKETGFFSNRWGEGLDWYLEHYQGSNNIPVRGEFTSYYLYDGNSVDRMFSSFGNLKIIAVVRDPVARALSQVKHGVRAGRIDIDGGEIALDPPLKFIESYPLIVLRSLYSEGLTRYREQFGSNNMLVFNQSDFRSHSNECLRHLWSFLGVEEDFLPSVSNKEVSPGIIPKYIWLEKVRRVIYAHMREVSGVVPFVRRIRLGELYRRFNKGQDISFSVEAESYLWELFDEDWRRTEDFVYVPEKL